MMRERESEVVSKSELFPHDKCPEINLFNFVFILSVACAIPNCFDWVLVSEWIETEEEDEKLLSGI